MAFAETQEKSKLDKMVYFKTCLLIYHFLPAAEGSSLYFPDQKRGKLSPSILPHVHRPNLSTAPQEPRQGLRTLGLSV